MKFFFFRELYLKLFTGGCQGDYMGTTIGLLMLDSWSLDYSRINVAAFDRCQSCRSLNKVLISEEMASSEAREFTVLLRAPTLNPKTFGIWDVRLLGGGELVYEFQTWSDLQSEPLLSPL